MNTPNFERTSKRKPSKFVALSEKRYDKRNKQSSIKAARQVVAAQKRVSYIPAEL